MRETHPLPIPVGQRVGCCLAAVRLPPVVLSRGLLVHLDVEAMWCHDPLFSAGDWQIVSQLSIFRR